MIVNDAASATVYVRSWTEGSWSRLSPMNVRRFRRAAVSQRGCALLCGDRQPTARAGHEAAAVVLTEAANAIERDLRVAGGAP